MNPTLSASSKQSGLPLRPAKTATITKSRLSGRYLVHVGAGLFDFGLNREAAEDFARSMGATEIRYEEEA